MSYFVVTGPFRSGTSYISALLNSQKQVSCVEDNTFINLKKKNFNYQEELLCYCNHINAKFIAKGIPSPNLHNDINSLDDLCDVYISFLKKILSCQNIGFKITFLNKNELIKLANEDFKIIIMKRSTEKILQSWVNRIDSNLNEAAWKLQKYLIQINYYNPTFLPLNSYKVIDYDDLLENPDKVYRDLGNFLGFEVKTVEELYFSFNKVNKVTFINNSSNYNNAHYLNQILPKKYRDEDYVKVSNLVDNKNFKIGLLVRILNKLNKLYSVMIGKI